MFKIVDYLYQLFSGTRSINLSLFRYSVVLTLLASAPANVSQKKKSYLPQFDFRGLDLEVALLTLASFSK